jgi:hypothetical protein
MSYHCQLLTSTCHWNPMESNAFPISRNPKHFQAMSMVTLIKHLLISSAILHLYQFVESAVRIRPSQILHLWFISHPPEKYPPHWTTHHFHEDFDNECKGFLSWVLHRTDSFPSFLVPSTCTYLSSPQTQVCKWTRLTWTGRITISLQLTLQQFGNLDHTCSNVYLAILSYLKGVGLLQQVALIESSDLSTQ